MGKAPVREGSGSWATGIWWVVRNWRDLPANLAPTCWFGPLKRGIRGKEPWVKVAGWQGRFTWRICNRDASRARKNNPPAQVDRRGGSKPGYIPGTGRGGHGAREGLDNGILSSTVLGNVVGYGRVSEDDVDLTVRPRT